ncbi:methyl-accepting chemotaxis protein [Photobacterium gaetbulicola]|uniref:Putative chemotaxis sensory transducer n=1 Tax=Photobacterium gaetbulicola Gung47 TaxID=658445 RepID=A0A0C5WPD6_9GAMM|nr:methyl-accepting chemotaxis protein [Photobacterium gaetbulicola]AJR09008.1 putative chemotaxis sensory transducer [Photobacterium gaetbulicola Gung47]PSU13564.1 methyl-accepting chemotaxis protein [Photobacterium gaetbulicola]
MNALSIKQRLVLLILIAVSSLLLATLLAVFDKRDSMLDERKNQIQILVETAETLVSSLHQQALQGQISNDEAKQRAISALNAMRYGDNGYFMVYDMTSTMVNHPINPTLNGKDLSKLEDINGVLIVKEQVIAAKQGGGFVSYHWKKASQDETPYPKIAYSLAFEPWGWVLNTGLYTDDVDTLFYQDVRNLMSLVALLTLLLIAVSLYINKTITSPLAHLQATLHQAGTNLDLTLRLAVEGKNEISAVGLAFNTLMAAFESTLQAIHAGAQQLEGQATKLEKLSSHIVGASNQQSDDTNSIAALVEEFSQSIHTISHDADTMNSLSNESGVKASEGASSMRAAIDNLNDMSQKSRRSSQAISALDQHSKQIEGIVSVINDVAEQTNLLALNAAIEAARAGEQGRGFAVVADEVRNLAVRTSDSTKQIASTIQELRSGIETTVVHIEDSVSSVSDNLSQTIEAETQVGEMHQMSQTLNTLIEEISCSLHEQSIANQELAERIQQIAEMATNNHQSASDVQGTAKEVSILVSSFHQSIGKFKVALQ